MLQYLPPESTIESTEEYTIVSIKGYARPVNLYLSVDPMDAVIHRRVQRYLASEFPTLVPQVYALKKYAGFSTEEAWCKVLQVQGDPYKAMLDEKVMHDHAQLQSQEWTAYTKGLQATLSECT
jgi:hypothetical protein